MLHFNLTDAEPDLVGVAITALVRMAGSNGPVVGVEVDREIAKETHRDFAQVQPNSPGMSKTNKLLIPV